MRTKLLFVAAALLLGACSSNGDSPSGGSGGAGGGGGGGGSGGNTSSSGGSAGSSTGGGSGTGGSGAGGASGSGGSSGTGTGGRAGSGGGGGDAASEAPASGGDASGEGGGAAGGKALLIVGALPLVRADIQLHAELVAKGMQVQDMIDGMSSTASADGKQLVIISYSIESDNVRGKFDNVKVPVMILEHVLLEGFGMTSASGHGWLHDVSQLTITAPPGNPLAAGFTGDVTVFTKPGGVFWGEPAASAVKVATAKGTNKTVLFGYEAGAMMVSKVAPAKRMLFFLGAHLDNAPALSPEGIKLFHAAVDWATK